MFLRHRKIIARIVVVVVVLFGVALLTGCSQEPSTPESRKESLKRLGELSNEDKSGDEKSASTPTETDQSSKEKQ
jgi:hypothetical protein